MKALRQLFILVLAFVPVFVSAQNRSVQQMTISGTVIDESGFPLVGAVVKNNATGDYSTTDGRGRYSLTVKSSSDVIEVNYLGYKPYEAMAGTQSNLEIVLVEDSQLLEETIVIGYGSKNKTKIVGSVNQVTSETFADKAIMNVGQALQGAIPNLNITVTDGKLNRNPTYNIRGLNSINGGSPLVLVDGVQGDINLVAPEDIESVSVLKDASSAAIYGAQASFGVILVTTKHGDSEKPKFRFTSNVGFSQPLKTPQLLMDGIKYADFLQQAYSGWAVPILVPSMRSQHIFRTMLRIPISLSGMLTICICHLYPGN